MTKQFAVSLGLFAVLAICLAILQPQVFQEGAVAADHQPGPVINSAKTTFQYGRLIFDDEQYNWIAGTGPVQRADSIRNLIGRLGGRVARADFAALLDTLGADGWELVFETEDPEGHGQVLIFKRTIN